MRILFITSSSINGGAQKHIKEMFKSLTELGNDVFLIAPHGWLTHELLCYQKNIIEFKLSFLKIAKISKYIDIIRPDIINTFILSGGFYGVSAWKRKKIGKLFVTVNNPVIYDGISLIRRFVYPIVYRWMAKYVSAFLTKSKKVGEEVKKITKNKKPIIAIKNGIDFLVFDKDIKYPNLKQKLDIPSNSIIVSNVAALDERKGQIHIIDAVKLLRDNYDIHLLLAGEGSYGTKIRSYVNKISATSYIHFLGKRDDVNCVLANSDIFVLSSYHEGLPNSLMEAMAMAKPCIATDVGGVRQLIDDGINGIIIKPKSSSEIENGILFFIQNPSESHKIALNAYNKMVNEYNQKNVTKELLEVYKKIS